jgi:predicted PurR-regulated permease PerM
MKAGPVPLDTAAREPEAKPELPPFPVPLDIRSVALTGLFILAVLYTSYLARAFIVPVILAVLLEFLFSPLVRRLKRARMPEVVSAALIVLSLVSVLAYTGYRLSGPAATWVARAPESLGRLEERLQRLRRPIDQVNRTADRVEKLTEIAPTDGKTAVTVELKQRTLAEGLLGRTQDILRAAIIVFSLLFFLLASGDLFLVKVIKVLPTLSDKKLAVQIARETEDQISHYLIATSVINVAFGVVVGVALKLLGMPNPVLWGVIAGITNYIPYVGSLFAMVVYGLAALLHFDDTGRALLVPATFFALNLLEGNVVTPMIVGRKLMLNPVVIFVGVLFWGWIWGVVGAVLAVPLLATFKIMCDRIQGLAPVGEFLGP